MLTARSRSIGGPAVKVIARPIRRRGVQPAVASPRRSRAVPRPFAWQVAATAAIDRRLVCAFGLPGDRTETWLLYSGDSPECLASLAATSTHMTGEIPAWKRTAKEKKGGGKKQALRPSGHHRRHLRGPHVLAPPQRRRRRRRRRRRHLDALAVTSLIRATPSSGRPGCMEIVWLGHSCFRIRGREATVVTDPCPPAVRLRHRQTHRRHRHRQPPARQPQLHEGSRRHTHGHRRPRRVRDPRRLRHRHPDLPRREKGAERGKNLAFVIEMEDIKIVPPRRPRPHPVRRAGGRHGRLPTSCSSPSAAAPRIDGAKAAEIVAMLEAKIVIPMHYKTDAPRRRSTPAERFLKEMEVKDVEPQPKLQITTNSDPVRHPGRPARLQAARAPRRAPARQEVRRANCSATRERTRARQAATPASTSADHRRSPCTARTNASHAGRARRRRPPAGPRGSTTRYRPSIAAMQRLRDHPVAVVVGVDAVGGDPLRPRPWNSS